jgi:acyl-CoA thioesterase-2
MADAERSAGIRELLRQIVPRPAGDDIFLFDDNDREHRQFGGVTIAQALVAAAQTATDQTPHALHVLFLRPHLPGAPVRYAVERLRDGRRFSTRRVQALQEGRLLSEATVGFTAGSSGVAYRAAAPSVPPPDSLPPFAPRHPGPAVDGDEESARRGFLFEQRLIRWAGGDDGQGAALDLWARTDGAVPDDAVTRAAVLGALSDLSSHFVGVEPGGVHHGGASLDHKLWWHALPPLDDWLLFTHQSDVAVQGRVWQSGALYTRAGLRCVSFAQEALLESGPRSDR